MIASLLRSLKCRQVGQVQMQVSVNGTDATPVASGPDAMFVASVVDGGAGLYTINVKEASKINLFVTGIVPITAGILASIVAVTTSSITIQCEDTAGLATDADFNIQWQHADQLSYYF